MPGISSPTAIHRRGLQIEQAHLYSSEHLAGPGEAYIHSSGWLRMSLIFTIRLNTFMIFRILDFSSRQTMSNLGTVGNLSTQAFYRPTLLLL